MGLYCEVAEAIDNEYESFHYTRMGRSCQGEYWDYWDCSDRSGTAFTSPQSVPDQRGGKVLPESQTRNVVRWDPLKDWDGKADNFKDAVRDEAFGNHGLQWQFVF